MCRWEDTNGNSLSVSLGVHHLGVILIVVPLILIVLYAFTSDETVLTCISWANFGNF